uniref:Uncharacterized protein n=1 Tax=Anguilla anguilla TaxID=7936 RepID=A0A0E9VP83_ANGAN
MDSHFRSFMPRDWTRTLPCTKLYLLFQHRCGF